jgi:hypothetical protein
MVTQLSASLYVYEAPSLPLSPCWRSSCDSRRARAQRLKLLTWWVDTAVRYTEHQLVHQLFKIILIITVLHKMDELKNFISQDRFYSSFPSQRTRNHVSSNSDWCRSLMNKLLWARGYANIYLILKNEEFVFLTSFTLCTRTVYFP